MGPPRLNSFERPCVSKRTISKHRDLHMCKYGRSVKYRKARHLLTNRREGERGKMDRPSESGNYVAPHNTYQLCQGIDESATSINIAQDKVKSKNREKWTISREFHLLIVTYYYDIYIFLSINYLDMKTCI